MDQKTIYILSLRDNKWWVGSTSDIATIYNDHITNNMIPWITKHPLVDIHLTFKGDIFDEDKYVKIMMAKHGISNVRGGRYKDCDLSPEIMIHLQQEISAIENRCIACGSLDHLSKDHNSLGKDRPIDIDKPSVYKHEPSVYKHEPSANTPPKISIRACNTYNNQDTININDGRDDQHSCSLLDSVANTLLTILQGCYAWYGQPITCSRCGKEGHSYLDCYATSHAKGWPL